MNDRTSHRCIALLLRKRIECVEQRLSEVGAGKRYRIIANTRFAECHETLPVKRSHDGGRRSAEVKRTRAAVEGALADFRYVALRSFTEVEDALVLETRQNETVAGIRAEIEVSQRLLEQAQTRYSEGLSNYLPVLSALQSLQRAELSLISAERQRLSYRIQLHRALGGVWPRALKPARDSKGESS